MDTPLLAAGWFIKNIAAAMLVTTAIRSEKETA
jgi:hypothetical protein